MLDMKDCMLFIVRFHIEDDAHNSPFTLLSQSVFFCNVLRNIYVIFDMTSCCRNVLCLQVKPVSSHFSRSDSSLENFIVQTLFLVISDAEILKDRIAYNHASLLQMCFKDMTLIANPGILYKNGNSVESFCKLPSLLPATCLIKSLITMGYKTWVTQTSLISSSSKS